MAYIGQEPGLGQAERFIFTASGNETSVTTADDGRVIGYTVGQVSVYLNGVKLVVGTDCIATNGSTITGLSALSASDVVEVIALSAFSPSDTVSAASGGTFSGAVTASAGVIGNLTGNASGTAATVTTAAQPAITSVGTLTGLALSGNVTMADDTSIGISDSAERIEFDGAGDISLLGCNVGINEMSPTKKLHITDNATESELIYLENNKAASISNAVRITTRLQDSAGTQTGFSILSSLSNITDGSEESLTEFKQMNAGTFASTMVLKGGNVGIGTTAPTYPFQIASQNPIKLEATSGAAATNSWYYTVTTSGMHLIRNSSTNNGAYLIYNAAGWIATSDRRWKTDWTPITGSLAKLDNIEVAKFHMLKGDDVDNLEESPVREGDNPKWILGVSAQDCVSAGLEDVVHQPSDGDYGIDNSQPMGINYSELTAVCVQAIQELSAKNDALEARLTALENA